MDKLYDSMNILPFVNGLNDFCSHGVVVSYQRAIFNRDAVAPECKMTDGRLLTCFCIGSWCIGIGNISSFYLVAAKDVSTTTEYTRGRGRSRLRRRGTSSLRIFKSNAIRR